MLFKKITSDRDPRDTVLREIGKEFRPYFAKAGKGFKRCTERYPKFLFAIMVINIVLSVTLCLTVYRPKKEPPAKITPPVTPGFDQLLNAAAAIRKTIRLKKQVDSLSKKQVLSKSDSDTLWSDLNQIKPLTHAY